MAQEKIYHMKSSIGLDELGRIAILMHQINVLEMEKSLWTYHLKSGTGTLMPPNEINLKIWSTHIITRIKYNQRATTISDISSIKVSDQQCINFVTNYLHELNDKYEQLQQELNLKKTRNFYGYTTSIDETLRTFIEEHQRLLCLKYEYKMKLIEFDYREKILDYVFDQENLNQKQVDSFFLFLISYFYIHFRWN